VVLIGGYIALQVRRVAKEKARIQLSLFEPGEGYGLAFHFPSMTVVELTFAPIVFCGRFARTDGPTWWSNFPKPEMPENWKPLPAAEDRRVRVPPR
jgi:hypothetical protein